MPYFNIVAETSENTVVTKYEPVKARSSNYQSEAELEKEFIRMLTEQGYEYLQIHTEKDLIANLRTQLERLNAYQFSASEWDRFFKDSIANQNEGIVEKTRKIQEDNVQVLKRDDGSTKNITLIDKKNIHNNYLQVINQYVIGKSDGAKHDNRYDVTILVNGFPLVHVELKRRGVAIREAFNQINRYQRDSFWAGSGLFEYTQIFVISNGTNTKYYSNSTRFNSIRDVNAAQGTKKGKTSNSFEFTSFWADANNRVIPDLIDFTRTFFAKHTILNIITKYCIFTSENMLMVMRPYQITATERILNRIEIANNYKKYGDVAGGGYIWHTTGSGKTLTSFKTARLASLLPYIDKVLFVVDRKDLDYQTMKEYDRFEKGAANSNTSTAVLKKQLEDSNAHIIITTIQKLATFIKKNKDHEVYNKHVVIIFDECHRSQFGDMHAAIVKSFKKYHLFGFTGTPIFPANTGSIRKPQFFTTEQIFGDQLHTYTIVDAINDKNVLPFRVDYIKTMDMGEDIDDEQVWDIAREKAMMAPERIKLVTEYILNNFDRKTYRGDKTYIYNTLTNISEVASGKKGAVEEIKQKQRVSGFNSIFAVASVPMAKLYYQEFKKQMEADPTKKLRIATIYSYGANEAEHDEDTSGILDEENSEDTSALDQSSRDFLDMAIKDYNEMFHTNYSTDSDKFQNYYKDVSLRMKNKELDLLIVVNMFLTGFDATTLNTLWVDKNLKMHGLIQAFSRTNRIFNSIKTFGNIVCFRNLQKQVDTAISLFGDKNAGGIVLMKGFKDYYYGYEGIDGKQYPGYVDMMYDLTSKFPLSEPKIIGEQNQKDFISLFGAILRMRNLLSAFDEFAGKEMISERDLQDYLGRYQDLRDEWNNRRKHGESTDITDDIVFEVELIKQIEINIDYILMLVKKYHDSHFEDKEVLVTIKKAINASPELRSKKALIETFIAGINDVEDVMTEWHAYVAKKREEELVQIIRDEKLKEPETRKFIENAFRDGEIKTTGTDIDKLMPPVSRFGGSNRAAKKQGVIDKLKSFFEKFFGVGGSFTADVVSNQPLMMVAEDTETYETKKDGE
ncbi:HsdR family type I site-specific deoxyribonuclease [Lactobacillus ruminis]|uniref:type I restriction endonuclease subunit R n=1 Tax=Ligilactobacillus ruminis TaxID=1623 RepID=UPI001021DCCB|nr:type I restriction endonuclease subunit R [Ligilactobacillus ruminis]MSB43477.1 HsdR family type I site-specific deoxyribonuclease [Ligilactobacillus ruminis]MSB54383.1 HsdR family type I site-specific deoxyribonuclease [Ligilactobacillus ruminis]MSB56165.1 HsdR family type I site-specific deoxyribonuclease [Ligilactobacillus ruminis]MSB81213.1 HsdR family type I site-specific deoxyribonuclease [Ligilactobacillus ruminis]MSB91024.1 HsdR family type I site-specific deoxyribonuclease [Ligilac